MKFFEELKQFDTRVLHAKANGFEFVEASPKMVSYHNPKGLGKSKFYWYNGIKVVPEGGTEAAMAEFNKDLATMMHGPTEGVVITQGAG